MPGRFESVDEGQPFTVLVDYAHTPDSLDTVLEAARDLGEGRVIVVFGAGGDRDRGKRPLMGKAAAELADVVIVTSDNPRWESPLAIIQDVLQGTGLDVEIDPDRRSAIERAIGLAEAGDVVVIAGKGHEQGQDIAGVVQPFDDREVAREALAARSRRSAQRRDRPRWHEIAGLDLGQLEGGVPGDAVTGIKADSREVGPGDLFVALNTGVQYVDEARARGAATLVPDDQDAALAALAALVRSKSNARVVAVVGSAGKTSTKDILGALCAPHAPTIASERSLNNEIGLPLTLSGSSRTRRSWSRRWACAGIGQIAALCAIARPTIALVTSIGPEHLELLGSVEQVAAANAEAIAALPPGGTAVVPAGAAELEPYLDRDDIAIRRFEPEDAELDGRTRPFHLDGRRRRARASVHAAASGGEHARRAPCVRRTRPAARRVADEARRTSRCLPGAARSSRFRAEASSSTTRTTRTRTRCAPRSSTSPSGRASAGVAILG